MRRTCTEMEFWDDLSGAKLDKKEVLAARKEELRFIEGTPLYEIADVTEV